MEIQLTFDDSKVTANIARLKAQAPIAIARALNKSIASGRTIMAREMSRDLGVKVGDVREKLTVTEATSTPAMGSVGNKGEHSACGFQRDRPGALARLTPRPLPPTRRSQRLRHDKARVAILHGIDSVGHRNMHHRERAGLHATGGVDRLRQLQRGSVPIGHDIGTGAAAVIANNIPNATKAKRFMIVSQIDEA